MASYRTLADELPITQISSHKYEVQFREEWTIGSVPNGGYVATAFLLTARKHMSLTNPQKSGPDPINMHLEYLRRTAANRAIFTIQDVKLGSRISNLHVTLSQERDDGRGWEDKVQGYITMTDLSHEIGYGVETKHKLHPPPPDVDLSLLAATGQDTNWSRRTKDLFGNFRKAHRNFQQHMVRPDKRTPDDAATATTDLWQRLIFQGKVPGRWTNDSLGLNVDIFPQMIEKFVNGKAERHSLQSSPESQAQVQKWADEGAAIHGKFWYPTLVLNLNIHKLLPVGGVEWLFVRLKAKTIKNGRYDLDVEVWDEEGELVATSHHACLVVDSARNLKRGKNEAAKL